MAKSYGRTGRPGTAKAATQPALATGEILIAIHGKHTLEQLARELQIAVARLQDAGAYGVEKFRIRLEPRNADGQPVILRDDAGQPITKMQIPEPQAEAPYRPDPYDAPAPQTEKQPAAIPSASVAGFSKR